ncbi:MAG: 2-C-methyl-D-erythritol 4-phosphate cytidylyltransferase [bacterium]
MLCAILTCAGIGTRMNSRIPKAFIPFYGKPLFFHALNALHAAAVFDQIIVAVPHERLVYTTKKIREWKMNEAIAIPGGRERQETVYLALCQLPSNTKYVLIHDGARPFATPDLIRRTLNAARRWGAATAALPCTDTLKTANGQFVQATLDRSKIFLIQTPQAFRFDTILNAHKKAHMDNFIATDDAAHVERIGHKVRIVPGNRLNLKITTRDDLKIAGIFASKLL